MHLTLLSRRTRQKRFQKNRLQKKIRQNKRRNTLQSFYAACQYNAMDVEENMHRETKAKKKIRK